MTFHEKLSRLTEDANRAKVCRRAGLPVNAISDYLNKSYIPRADTAMKLAVALRVSLHWLMDDSAGFPAVRIDQPETCHAA